MLKRLIDVLLAIIIMLLGSPIIFLILLIVLIIMRENPLIFQVRKITLDKKEIKVIKIRTIKSSKNVIELEEKCINVFIKSEFKQFVPFFCRWLRKTGIDEIPQVLNVLKGEMSFVGPRPFPENDLVIMERLEPKYYSKRMSIVSKPGITGYWQVFGNREEGTPNLIECDEQYEKQKSFSLDLKIAVKTIFVLITAKHSDAIIISKSPMTLSSLEFN